MSYEEQIKTAYQDGWAEGYNRGRKDAFEDLDRTVQTSKEEIFKQIKDLFKIIEREK